jgi:hypothetical protein
VQSGVSSAFRAETNNGGNWLTVNPSGAVYETAREFQVVANATGLPRGTYQGSVIVTPDQNLGGEVRIPVTVVVTAVNTLAISQTQLTFTHPGHAEPDDRNNNRRADCVHGSDERRSLADRRSTLGDRARGR